ncbi:hypothetical protein EIP86_007006 [Pleurotus ostreatoroseus]|nr:hypothetical protein EIP86_007006 [Pleurotus ostreatoroseus]
MDRLEPFFARIEAESAQRAHEEEENERLARAAEGRLTVQEITDLVLAKLKLDHPELWVCCICKTRFSGSMSTIDDSATDGEASTTTQHIQARKYSLVGAISRRLSSACNAPPRTPTGGLVIGVAVEEAVVEYDSSEDSDSTIGALHSVVHKTPLPVKKKASWVSKGMSYIYIDAPKFMKTLLGNKSPRAASQSHVAGAT